MKKNFGSQMKFCVTDGNFDDEFYNLLNKNSEKNDWDCEFSGKNLKVSRNDFSIELPLNIEPTLEEEKNNFIFKLFGLDQTPEQMVKIVKNIELCFLQNKQYKN